ncbi:MAG: tetratricopeptide repeat protein [Clostridia bacterium]|nr:tetratricopeptide repeat protein [Clostridia bacterium]
MAKFHYKQKGNSSIEQKPRVYSIRRSQSSETLTDLEILYKACLRAENYRKACDTAQKIWRRRKKIFGEMHEKTLQALGEYGEVYRKLGKYRNALESGKRSYEIRMRLLGESHPKTLHTLRMLADGYAKCGDLQKSAEVWEKAYACSRKLFGETATETLSCKTAWEAVCQRKI